MSISSRIILTYAKINNHKFTLIILVPKVTLKIDPSGKPTPTENSNVAPQPFLPITAPYICLACCQNNPYGCFFLTNVRQINYLGTLLYDFSRSIKNTCNFFFFSLNLSVSCLERKIASIVDLPGINSNKFSKILDSNHRRCSIVLSPNFIVWLINLIAPYSCHNFNSLLNPHGKE